MADSTAPADTTATLWRPALAEFFATLLFVFLGPCAVVVTGMMEPAMTPARLAVIALAHGLAIVALATASGPISGGHINPAVTIGALVTGKITTMRAVWYIVAQLAGAVAGSILLSIVVGGSGSGLGSHGLGTNTSMVQGLIAEVILTFALVGVIFATAVDPRGLGGIATIAIGFTVLIDHLAGVPLTGASMNPARSFGPWLLTQNVDFVTHIVVYWVGPIAGGILAALVYENVFMHRD